MLLVIDGLGDHLLAQLGPDSALARMHSGNGEHDEMDRRAVACFTLALDDAGVQDRALRGLAFSADMARVVGVRTEPLFRVTLFACGALAAVGRAAGYASHTPGSRNLDQALIAQDLQRVADLAHQIKGVAGGLGYPAVGNEARAAEAAARAGDPTAAGTALAALRRAEGNVAFTGDINWTKAGITSQGKVKIVAMDRGNDVLDLIGKGVISASVAQQTALMPYYALLLKNKGKEAGASLSHPHSQIVATPMAQARQRAGARRARPTATCAAVLAWPEGNEEPPAKKCPSAWSTNGRSR